jgi:hypothetical protein
MEQFFFYFGVEEYLVRDMAQGQLAVHISEEPVLGDQLMN